MPENLNLKTVETVDTSPFRKLVMTIGELPSAFVESMTYYELLAWFVNYLETVIIPTVNNNAEAVEELQDNFVELKNDTDTEISRFETELTTAFNQLKDFVDNYFDNLDVQEEINNKLDEMAEAGTLQEIITQYINTTALWMFDNVAAMKLATNFVNGSYAKTLGFYAKNDKGGATYKIRTKTESDTANEMTLIDLYDNTLIAELIPTPIMNVKQFGAKGDGETDDTTAIQTAMDTTPTIVVTAGTYMINAVTELKPNTNNKITLDKDAKLKAITNSETHYRIFHINNVNNVEISGGTLEGDRLTHTGTEGEWGNCIRIAGTSDNIYIHDINLINAWGDGLGVVTTGSVATARVHVKNARRNGFSIGAASSFVSNDDIIEDTNGTAPQYGVDIEPDNADQVLKNIVFNNLITLNNAAGGGFQIHLVRTTSFPARIVVNNYRSDGDAHGVVLTTESTHAGLLIMKDPVITNCGGRGFLIENESPNFRMEIIRPYITGYAVSSTASAGIVFTGSATDGIESGNVLVYEPTVINPVGEATIEAAIRFNTGAYKYKNIFVIDPLDLGGTGIAYNNTGTDHVVFTDKYEITRKDIDANYTTGSPLNMVNTSDSYTADRRITMSGTIKIPIGTEVAFYNTGDYKMNVKFTDKYIYPLVSATGKTVTLNDKGASMKIRRISSDAWMVISQTGTITTD